MAEESYTQQLRNILIQIHTELSSLSNSPLSLSLEEALDSTHQQCVQAITETLSQLFIIHREFTALVDAEEFDNNSKYQKALQKLEGEVRNHIMIQEQMKIMLQSTQSELNRYQQNNQELIESVYELQQENDDLIKNAKQARSPKTLFQINRLRSTAKKDQAKLLEYERINKKLVAELSKSSIGYKQMLVQFDLVREKYQKLRKSLVYKENQPNILEFYKKKYDEKCKKVQDLERDLRNKSPFDHDRALMRSYRSIKMPADLNRTGYSSQRFRQFLKLIDKL